MTTHDTAAQGPTTQGPLPSGRRAAGAMTSAEVAEHQRARMLEAMTDAVAERGYAAVTVADVISRASVSRATFYEQFADKRACFLAAYELASTVMLTGTEIPAGTPLSALVQQYLDVLCAHPGYARVFTVEINSLGTEGMAIRRVALAQFADVVAAAVGVGQDDRFACDAFVAAVAMMVSLRLAEDDVDGVRALAGPLVDLARRLFGPAAG